MAQIRLPLCAGQYPDYFYPSIYTGDESHRADMEIRKRGFRNEVFQTLEKVIDRLCEVINDLSSADIKSITGRQWILDMF